MRLLGVGQPRAGHGEKQMKAWCVERGVCSLQACCLELWGTVWTQCGHCSVSFRAPGPSGLSQLRPWGYCGPPQE